jgi:hypothetical protein
MDARPPEGSVILGLQDTISARDNVRIMERAKSRRCSRTTTSQLERQRVQRGGRDPVARPRSHLVHLRPRPPARGPSLPSIVAALADIGFTGWAQLETDNPTKAVEADLCGTCASCDRARP